MKTFKYAYCKKCGRVEINPSGFFVRCDECGTRMKKSKCPEGIDWYIVLLSLSVMISPIVKGFLRPFRYIRYKLYMKLLEYAIKRGWITIVY